MEKRGSVYFREVIQVLSAVFPSSRLIKRKILTRAKNSD